MGYRPGGTIDDVGEAASGQLTIPELRSGVARHRTDDRPVFGPESGIDMRRQSGLVEIEFVDDFGVAGVRMLPTGPAGSCCVPPQCRRDDSHTTIGHEVDGVSSHVISLHSSHRMPTVIPE